MKKRFPEFFEATKTEEVERPAKRSGGSVVAPVKRTSGSKTKITLTSTQVAVAKRLGVPLELYAKHVASEEAKHG